MAALATGAWDRDIAGRVWWSRQFGVTVTAEQVADMHPLRRLERPPPSAAERQAESSMGWAVLGGGLKALNQMRGK